MEGSHSPGRLAAGTLTLALVVGLLALQVTTATPAAAAAISVSPSAGVAGTAAQIDGSAYLPLLPLDLCWGGESCANLGSVTADATGNFGAGITVPDVAAGRYTISACQTGTGCASTVFDVLAPPNDSTTTTAATTTTSNPTTTSTAGTSSTTRPSTTTTTRPTTTTQGPTTTGPTTTTLAPTTSSSADGTTSTTEVVAISTDTTVPLVEASAAPFAFDLDALIEKLFAPDPDTSEDTTEAPDGSGLLALAPSAAVEPVDSGGSGGVAGPLFPRLPQLGIWVTWTLAIIGVAALVFTLDEIRRRRSQP